MPTHAHTYARRKAAGQCPYDGRPAQPGKVCCALCAATQRRYHAQVRAAEKTRQAALQARMQAAGIYVAYPPRPAPPPRPATTPAVRELLCCGTWWQITHIPLVVPCCNRRWLQEREDQGDA